MTTRTAACSCGQLRLDIEGEPARVSMCHCLECQRRTGAVISNQARFRPEQITASGKSTAWQRTADSGSVVTFHFCPTCGSTVYWTSESFPGFVVVAIGNFALKRWIISRLFSQPLEITLARRCHQIPRIESSWHIAYRALKIE